MRLGGNQKAKPSRGEGRERTGGRAATEPQTRCWRGPKEADHAEQRSRGCVPCSPWLGGPHSLASGRGGPRYCGGQQSGLKKRLSSPALNNSKTGKSGRRTCQQLRHQPPATSCQPVWRSMGSQQELLQSPVSPTTGDGGLSSWPFFGRWWCGSGHRTGHRERSEWRCRGVLSADAAQA
jgi:hypothetical protein